MRQRKREQTQGVQAQGRRHVLREVHVLYPCWERSVHTLLATGARLCFCTRDGATTGAVRPVVLGHTLSHARKIHTRCLAYRGKGASLKPGEGSEGVGCCPSCTCIGGRSSLRPFYTPRSGAGPHHILDGPGLVRACGREAARRSGHGVPIAACTQQATHLLSTSWPGCVSEKRMSRSWCWRYAVTRRNVAVERNAGRTCVLNKAAGVVGREI